MPPALPAIARSGRVTAILPQAQAESRTLTVRIELPNPGLRLRLGTVRSQGLMTHEDAYHYGHHEPVQLPVWRVILADGARYYLDPTTGEVIGTADAPAKGFRWLHLGLHLLDFVLGFDRGPGWAGVMTVLQAFAGLSVATGVLLAWRRVKTDVGSTTLSSQSVPAPLA